MTAPPTDHSAEGRVDGPTWVERFPHRLHRTTTLLDRGTLVHDHFGDVPAFRTVNSVYGQEWVWAYTFRNSRKGRHYGPAIGPENHVPGPAYRAER